MPSIIAVSSIFSDGRDTLPRSYSRALYGTGSIPFILSPSEQLTNAVAVASSADALLLSGGGDIYNDNSQNIRNTDRLRDNWEMLLISAFIAQDKKILGICRGLQVISAYFGGLMLDDIHTEIRHQDNNDVFHEVEILPGTLLSSILGSGLHRVNSSHHQSPLNIPSSLELCAKCSDGIIEGLERPGIVGVQWHPERLDTLHTALFKWLAEKP